MNFIFQDKKGFLWIATNNGLNKFDGYTFNIYRHSITNPNSISDNRIFSISEDLYNNIWILTEKGLNKFSKIFNSFELINIGKDQIFDFSIQSDTVIWILTGKKIIIYNIEKNRITNSINLPKINLPENSFTKVKVLKDYLLLTAKKEVFILNITNLSINNIIDFNKYPLDIINTVFIDNFNFVWILGNNNFLINYNLITKEIVKPKFNQGSPGINYNFHCAIRDQNNNMIFSTDKGIYILDEKRNLLSPFSVSKQDLPDFSYLLLDFSYNLWYGNNIDGLYKFDLKTKFSKIFTIPSEIDQKASSISFFNISRDSSILLNKGNSLYKFQMNSDKFKVILKNINNQWMLNDSLMLISSINQFWILNIINSKLYNTKDFSENYSAENTQNRLETVLTVICKLIKNKEIIDIKTGKNKFAVLMRNNFLFYYDLLTNKSYEINLNSLLSTTLKNLNANTIFIEDHRNILIGTNDGILVYDLITKNFNLTDEISQFDGNIIKSISKDNLENLWITATDGVFRYNSSTGNINYLNFKNLPGLDKNVFAYFEKLSNKFFLSTQNSIHYLNSTEIFEKLFVSRLAITNIVIIKSNGNTIILNPEWGDIELSYDEFFSIEFANLDYTNPLNNKFSYRINELHKNFIPLQEQRKLPFLRLEPGTYTLELISASETGFWNQNPLKLKVIVSPPFWKNFLFQILLFASSIIIFIILLKQRLKNLNKQKRELEELVEQRTKKLEVQKEELTLLFESFRESEAKFKSIFENAAVGIFRINQNGNIILINKTLLKLLGFSTLDAGNQLSIEQHFFRDSLQSKISLLETYGYLSYMKEWKKDTSEKVIFRETIKEFKSIGTNEIFYDGVVVDITEQIKVQDKINQFVKELKDSNETKDKIFSIIGHDLRNPLTVLISTSDFLRRRMQNLDTEKVNEFLTTVYYSSRSLASLLENLLEWGRTQTGKIQFNPDKHDLTHIVEKNLSFFGLLTKQKNVKIINLIKGSLYWVFDEKLINTVIRNLINNAIKYSQTNGIIEIDAKITENHLNVSISDKGLGINDNIKESLLKNNFLISEKGTANETGTGLGLKICREFVEKHNGKIWFRSQKNLGSTFYFYIPDLTNKM